MPFSLFSKSSASTSSTVRPRLVILPWFGKRKWKALPSEPTPPVRVYAGYTLKRTPRRHPSKRHLQPQVAFEASDAQIARDMNVLGSIRSIRDQIRAAAVPKPSSSSKRHYSPSLKCSTSLSPIMEDAPLGPVERTPLVPSPFDPWSPSSHLESLSEEDGNESDDSSELQGDRDLLEELAEPDEEVPTSEAQIQPSPDESIPSLKEKLSLANAEIHFLRGRLDLYEKEPHTTPTRKAQLRGLETPPRMPGDIYDEPKEDVSMEPISPSTRMRVPLQKDNDLPYDTPDGSPSRVHYYERPETPPIRPTTGRGFYT